MLKKENLVIKKALLYRYLLVFFQDIMMKLYYFLIIKIFSVQIFLKKVEHSYLATLYDETGTRKFLNFFKKITLYVMIFLKLIITLNVKSISRKSLKVSPSENIIT